MSVGEHKLEIFRGLIKFKSNEQKIWGVLIFLSIVTIIEVALGIIKPDFLSAYFMRMKLLNWIKIIRNLTSKDLHTQVKLLLKILLEIGGVIKFYKQKAK